MPIFYMAFWSFAIIFAVGVWRLRSWRHVAGMVIVTLLVLMFSKALFIQLSISAGLDPSMALMDPGAFVMSGPYGWLALLVMPCGWLGPILGLNLVERWQDGNWDVIEGDF
jgi:hypothetical protein